MSYQERQRRTVQGADRRNGLWTYTVACVGLFETALVTVRLRSGTQYDNARAIARQRVPGQLSYNVIECDKE
jgi:hypothetical protein